NGALTVWPARANSATKSARQISAGPAQGRDSGRAKKSAKSKRGPASCGPLARAEPYTSPASGGKLAEASAHAHDRALVRRLGPMVRGAPADARAVRLREECPPRPSVRWRASERRTLSLR